jgi:hypothetical protein
VRTRHRRALRSLRHVAPAPWTGKRANYPNELRL